MDEAFFIASKTLGRLSQVESWLVIFLVMALVAGLRGRHRRAQIWVGLTLAVVLGLTIFPLGTPLMADLESRYPRAPDVTNVDAIIVLGGAEDLGPFGRWGGVQTNDAGERLAAGVELAKRFPNARLVYTGGTAGLVSNPNPGTPSRMVAVFWHDMGVPDAQVTLESKSRDTWENAVFTKDLLNPSPDQKFLLVTSAWHMPRAMDTFARAGWKGVTAWPVDFRSARDTFHWDWKLDDHLMEIDTALKEDLGRLAYYLAGKL